MFIKIVLLCGTVHWAVCAPANTLDICALPSCACEGVRVSCVCPFEGLLLLKGTTTPPTATIFELSKCERATLPIGVLGRNITTVKITKIGSLEVQKNAFFNPLKFSLTLWDVAMDQKYSFDSMKAENVLFKGVAFKNLSGHTFDRSDMARVQITNCTVDVIEKNAVNARVGQFIVDNTRIETIKEEAFSFTSFDAFELWSSSVGVCEKKAFVFHHSVMKTEPAILFHLNKFDIIKSDFFYVRRAHQTNFMFDKFQFTDNKVGVLDEDAFKHVNKDHFTSVTLSGNKFTIADRQGTRVGGSQNTELGNNMFNCEIHLCYLLSNHIVGKKQQHHTNIYNKSKCVPDTFSPKWVDLDQLYSQYQTPYECIEGLTQMRHEHLANKIQDEVSREMERGTAQAARDRQSLIDKCSDKITKTTELPATEKVPTKM